MRSFSKKLAFALAAAMVVTVVTPAAQAKAADDFTLNRTEQTLYVNKGVNDKGVVGGGLYGNVQTYDFNLKNKPSDWKDYGYKWTSSDAKVATVASGGITTAVGVGTATISCVITDKATGEIATTLKAKVTVKANAKEVIISNAAQYDDQTVEVGDVVDLNRTLVDENGKKSSSKGKYVTDLTKWVAEPSKGVEINQSNGQYTFTEEAVAGDYKLYCYTYQSSKYTNRTAESEPVTVTLQKEKTFEVKQTSLKALTVNFGSKVKELGLNDVQIIRLYGNDTTYQLPQVVKQVDLAADGLSASVQVFTPFENDVNYIVKVTGYEDYAMRASAGTPVRMTISADKNTLSPFVTVGSDGGQIHFHLYDKNDVDVTSEDERETVIFDTKDYSADGSYYVSGNRIYFMRADVSARVKAVYHSGDFKDGNEVGNLEAEFDFVGQNVPQILVKDFEATLSSTYGDYNKALSVPIGDGDGTHNLMLNVKAHLFNDASWAGKKDVFADEFFGEKYPGASIRLEEATPDVLTIYDGHYLRLHKEGKANILVNQITRDSNNEEIKTPVYVIPVTVTAARNLTTLSVDNPQVVVGIVEGRPDLSKAVLKFTAKDQYGADIDPVQVKVNGLTKQAEELRAGVEVNLGDKTITLNGDILGSAIADGMNMGTLNYKIQMNSNYWQNKEINLVVMLRKPIKDAEGNLKNPSYEIKITNGSLNGNIARTKNPTGNPGASAAKTATFTAYKMSNGIRYEELPVSPYPKDGKLVEGQYYYKVTKNGNDITNEGLFWNATEDTKKAVVSVYAVSGSAVAGQEVGGTIRFSCLANIDTNNSFVAPVGTVTGSAFKVVSYDGSGAGNYQVTLYQGVKQSGTNTIVPVQKHFVAGTTTFDAGSYSAAKRISETIDKTAVTPENIRACFEIKTTQSWENAGAPYSVDFVDTDDYVYVRKITFYDKLGNTDEYAPYEVQIGTSLRKVTP